MVVYVTFLLVSLLFLVSEVVISCPKQWTADMEVARNGRSRTELLDQQRLAQGQLGA